MQTAIEKIAALTSTRRTRAERQLHRDIHGDPVAREARTREVCAELRKLANKLEADLS